MKYKHHSNIKMNTMLNPLWKQLLSILISLKYKLLIRKFDTILIVQSMLYKYSNAWNYVIILREIKTLQIVCTLRLKIDFDSPFHSWNLVQLNHLQFNTIHFFSPLFKGNNAVPLGHLVTLFTTFLGFKIATENKLLSCILEFEL